MVAWSRAASVAAFPLVLAATACGAGANDSQTFSPGTNGGNNADAGTTAPFADAGLPEKKVEGDYQSPVATGQFVWIANPTSGRVAYIRATTLDVRTVLAGNGPTYLAAVPDPTDDVAIVINVLSQDATLLRAKGAGALVTKTFPIAANANNWAIARDGRFAIAWADAAKFVHPDKTQGFQDLAVLDLSSQKPPIVLAVGYRPVKVAFSSDGARAFAITQDGISVIDVSLAPPKVIANFPISDDPLEDPGTRDVSITPDGAFALVRRDARADITVVALKDGARTTVMLPAAATDLTLAQEGDRAIAVMRDASSIAILPIPRIATEPTSFTTLAITGQTVGRAIIAKGGKSALLFTTALPVERLTVLTLDPAPPSFRVRKLYAPLLAVFPTDDSLHALVVHDIAVDTKPSGAFSLVPLTGDLPGKIVATSAPPTAVALSPASDRALVAVRHDASGTFGAYLAKLPSFEATPYTLASPPTAVGVIAGANRAYVAQQHPDGRITFIDLATGGARTITGFELGSRIVDGSKP